jgi:deoxycytidine triphosphate deaminase
MAIAEVIEITSDRSLKGYGSPGILIVESNELLKLNEYQLGRIEGKRGHHHDFIFMQGGIINSGWEGRLTVELIHFGTIKIEEGEKVAHAVITTYDEPVKVRPVAVKRKQGIIK